MLLNKLYNKFGFRFESSRPCKKPKKECLSASLPENIVLEVNESDEDPFTEYIDMKKTAEDPLIEYVNVKKQNIAAEDQLIEYMNMKPPRTSISAFLESLEEDMAKLSPKGLRKCKKQMLTLVGDCLELEGKD